MMMVSIAAMPVPVMCPTTVSVPPSGVIPPVPGRMPSEPHIAPEPVIDHRTIHIYRLYDIVRAIDVLVAHYLNAHIVRLVFLYIYGGYVLIDILRKDSLQYDQALVAFTGLYDPQVIHFTVSVEIQVAERAVRVVKHRLELFQVLSLRKKLSYHLQVQSF